MTESPARNAGRVNIAFTPEAAEAARRICGVLPFTELVDIARIGVAYALRTGVPLERPADFGSASGSNFNIGSIDAQGELRGLLTALHPENDDDPGRVLETLMSVGTLKIAARVAEGEIRSLHDLIDPPAE